MDSCRDCVALEHRVARIEARLRALGQGLGDVEPTTVSGAPKQAPRAKAPEAKPDCDGLRLLRPKVWESGRRAAADGISAEACPYLDTRGGFRNAWLGGHAASKGQASAPESVSAKGSTSAPRITAAFQRGERAARAGDPVSECPFGLNESRNRDEWQRGWRNGRSATSPGATAKACAR